VPDEPVDPEVRRAARPFLLVVAVVVLAQAAALLTLTALELASVEAGRVGLGVSTAVFLGALGVLMVVAVVRLLGLHAWPRGFLVFSQLLCLVLSFNFRGDAGWITPTLALPALVALGCLLAPAVTRALGRDQPV
jgi:hypothetical protein